MRSRQRRSIYRSRVSIRVFSRDQSRREDATQIDPRGNIPSFVHVSDDKTHEVNGLDILPPEPGSFTIMGRGFLDFAAEGNKTLAARYHGTDGPLRVECHLPSSALVERYLAAAQEVGIPFNPAFDGEFQEGCGPANRARRGAADAYLHRRDRVRTQPSRPTPR
jgi:hypothetical protein